MLAAPAALGKSYYLAAPVRQLQVGVTGKRREPGPVGGEKLDPAEIDEQLALGPIAASASQALGDAQQSGLEFAAKNRSDAEPSQEHFVHRRIQSVNAQVGPGGERLDARNRFDRDARRGVHADVDRHEAGAG